MKQITDLSQIDYKENAEGRLLFTAMTILTTENYPSKTPDEVIALLNEKSKWLDEENKTQTSIQEKEQDMGTCRESNCKEKAVIDYNGHGHFVCQPHYENTFKSDKSSH